MDLTVVIVSYNVRSFLDHCLQSIRRAGAGLQVQVIVVDNASSDGSADFVAERYPEVTLIANQENVGFGCANNQAFERVTSDAILLLNPDAFVQEDTLRILLQKLRERPDLGALGPKIIQPDGSLEPRSKRGFPTPWAAFSYLSGLSALFPKSRFFSRYLLTYLDPDQEHEVDALSGCCMLLRRAALEKVGGFDPDYFLYGEDLDLCFRIRGQDYHVLYTPATKIVHFKGESTRRSTIDRQYHFRRAMRLFVAKNLSHQVSWIARGLMTLGFWLQDLEGKLTAITSKVMWPFVDVVLLNLLILISRWIRFSTPTYSLDVWVVNGVYTLFYILSGLSFGLYTRRRYSGRGALFAALTGFVLASAFTYFFNQWAFSRLVVLGFSLGMIILMPGWRIVLRRWLQQKSPQSGRRWGRRRTLIVGTDALAQNLAQQIARDPAHEWDVVGYVVFAENGVGEVLHHLPVLGTVQELDRLIRTEEIQEVLFSTGAASYETIIALVQKLWRHSLEFRIIPRDGETPGQGLPLLRLELSNMPSGKRRADVQP